MPGISQAKILIVATDGGIITSRNPGDFDACCAKIVEEVKEGGHEPPQLPA